jgi:hypothetical protein
MGARLWGSGNETPTICPGNDTCRSCCQELLHPAGAGAGVKVNKACDPAFPVEYTSTCAKVCEQSVGVPTDCMLGSYMKGRG